MYHTKTVQLEEGVLEFLKCQLLIGEVVAIPTETVYGLAADARNQVAIQKIYEAKNRPILNPLVIHYSSLEALRHDVEMNEIALKLAKRFWPGPLTLVLPKKKNSRIAELVPRPTLAVRIPSHPLALELISKCNFPLAAPSANLSGNLSPTNAYHVMKELCGKIGWILDGGESNSGIESTILDLTERPCLLRAGAISIELLNEVLDGRLASLEGNNAGSQPKAPGVAYKHYAPGCSLRLSTENPLPNEALLAFGSRDIPPGYQFMKNLSPGGNLEEAARNLFGYLRDLSELGVARISVMPIPKIGIGLAIYDRLLRAASAAEDF